MCFFYLDACVYAWRMFGCVCSCVSVLCVCICVVCVRVCDHTHMRVLGVFVSVGGRTGGTYTSSKEIQDVREGVI